MARLGRVLSIVALLIASCARPDVAKTEGPVRFASKDVPWSFRTPSGWDVSTLRSDPDPDLKTGVLSTYVTNVTHSFGPASPGPNSNAGASDRLGPSAAVVEVSFLWDPPDEPIRWDPTTPSMTVRCPAGWPRCPTRWHADAQNPGWVFRERRVCSSENCVWIVEWHGPDASEDSVRRLERIAESLELAPGWTDPTV
jgi:hypothetical protein